MQNCTLCCLSSVLCPLPSALSAVYKREARKIRDQVHPTAIIPRSGLVRQLRFPVFHPDAFHFLSHSSHDATHNITHRHCTSAYLHIKCHTITTQRLQVPEALDRNHEIILCNSVEVKNVGPHSEHGLYDKQF
jgi:hypothetical protein